MNEEKWQVVLPRVCIYLSALKITFIFSLSYPTIILLYVHCVLGEVADVLDWFDHGGLGIRMLDQGSRGGVVPEGLKKFTKVRLKFYF